uniref:HMG box domain-containing protein n=1 Tax=Clastoptera arizonana TaxID=38151 RepID=A0A1B6DRC3_9HEMI
MATNSSSQQFNLRWNNHTSNILQVFLEQLTEESLVDVTLSCQGKFIKAHKMVLSACSPYFQELFKQHQVSHPVIIINGMKFLDVKLIVEFMYKGEIKVQESDLSGVLLAAETLQIKGLSNVRNKYEQSKNTEVPEAPSESPAPSTSPKPRVKTPTDPFKARTARVYKNNSTDSEDIPKTIEDTNKQREDSTDDISKNSAQTKHTPGVEPDVITPGRSLLKSNQNNPKKPVEDDDDLPSLIKVEPPDIRDIDEEEPYAGWESPRLVIDMQDTKNVELIQPKLQMKSQLRQLQYSSASAHIELAEEDKSSASCSPEETVMIGDTLRIIGSAPPPKKKLKIPRPPNAFMIFANEWRRKLAYQNPLESNKEISVRLGVMWKNLSADTKESYYSASRKADEDHKRKYPGYYYSPKEARIRKTLKLGRRSSPPAQTPGNVEALHLVKVYMPEDRREKSSRPIILSKSLKKPRAILPKPLEPNEETMEVDEEVEEVAVMESGSELVDEDEEEEVVKIENGDEEVKSE